MSNELSIQAIPHLLGAGDNTAAHRNPAPAPVVAPVAPDAKPVKFFVNPDFRFDAAAGLAVIEFRDNAGKVTDSIPNQRQLDAYRTHQGTQEGPSTLKPADDTASTG
ncbi:MAG: hypothetical protein EXR07_20530 [Acetobacteraceae bacterium]|nr:hypothetical protein [Acetobacteraceae bacterium]